MANGVKEIRYLNKDFAGFRADLIEFAKQYYPNTYNDFNEASPGMMFLERAAYVGDVMSFYTDLSFKESLLPFAEELETVYKIAQTYGYKPSLSYPSQAQLDVYVVIPANAEGNPDYDYAPRIKAGMQVTAQGGQTFRVPDPINFQASGSRSPIGVTMYEQDSSGLATKYLLQKQANSATKLQKKRCKFTTRKKQAQKLFKNLIWEGLGLHLGRVWDALERLAATFGRILTACWTFQIISF